MRQYHELLKEILRRGDVQFEPRTQEHTIGISAWLSTYDLREGFPIVTTKNVPPRLPFEEVFWKLRGERNIMSLFNKGIHFWDANAFDRYLKVNGLTDKFPKHSQAWNEEFNRYKERLKSDPEFAEIAGDLGPVYGYQWRHWLDSSGNEVDQLANLLKKIKSKPDRYLVLSSWNVGDLPDMALGPCPFWHQFTVYGDRLDLTLVQRSCDSFLGVPFNTAQDSLLAHMVANEAGLQPRFFNHSYINTHIYLGVSPRADFWTDEQDIKEFQGRIGEIKDESEYLDLREWYLKNAPEESPENLGKDHTPFVLEQLSKKPGKLPTLEIMKDVSLLEAIKMNALDYAKLIGYEPAKWNSKAVMAA